MLHRGGGDLKALRWNDVNDNKNNKCLKLACVR